MVSIKPIRNPEIKYNQNFVNNEWIDSVSGKRLTTINPATESKICDVAAGDAADIDIAVKAAKDAFKLASPWRTMDSSQRGRLLFKWAELIERDSNYIACLNTLDNGKPFSESMREVSTGIKMVQYCAGWADKLHGKTIPMDGNHFAYTRLEPIGVCGGISPWNVPIVQFVNKVAPALGTGNTVVIKPAEQTPLVALYLASLIEEAGFPAGVVNVVNGYGITAGAALADHLDVNKICFTGSTQVGKKIQEAAGRSNTKKVSLELGGKSPLVIFDDVDLNEAVQLAHRSIFANQGEICFSASRCFVQETIYDEFVEKSKNLAAARVVGDPFDPNTTQGAQISEQQLTRILDFIKSGIAEGAKLEIGGERLGSTGYFIKPTIFSNVKDTMKIAREEIFGPVQQIMKFSTFEEVVERANNTNYGLAAGILTKDLDRALMFSQAIQSGVVWVNSYMMIGPQTPFGGYKMSGFGKENGEEGMLEFCQTKTVITSIQQKNS